MNKHHTALLIVQNSAASANVLRFVQSNIENLNKQNIAIKCVEYSKNADRKLIDLLKEKRIDRLPCIILHNQIYMGQQNILETLTQHIRARTARPIAPYREPPPSAISYKLEPESDEDNESEDIMKSYHEQIRKRGGVLPSTDTIEPPKQHKETPALPPTSHSDDAFMLAKLGLDEDSRLCGKKYEQDEYDDQIMNALIES